MGPIQQKTIDAVEAVIKLGFSKLEEERKGYVSVRIEDLQTILTLGPVSHEDWSAAKDRILGMINGNGSDTTTDSGSENSASPI